MLLLLGSATFGARAAYACSCVGPAPSVRAAVLERDIAFVGEVTRHLGDGVYEARVDGVLKGSLGHRVRLEVDRRTSCATTLGTGPIIYTGDRDLSVHLCSWVWTGDEVTRLVAAEQLVTTIPSPDVGVIGPDDPPATDWRPWAAGAGVVVALAVAAMVASRRRAAQT
ncbi:MAG TPA: hypothetical protein VNA20_05975 [Frankiaceae bacterium]|nr:hypothetical protein [Frankiaceae bacterium]